MSRLVDSAVFIAILTAFLFSLSIANYSGYLTEFGVNTSFILRSSHQILYNSLFVILAPALTGLAWAFVAIVVLRLLVTLYVAIVKNCYKIKKCLVRLRSSISSISGESKAEVWANRVVGRLRIVPSFLIFLAFLGSLVYAENEGKKNAREKLLEIENGIYKQHEMVEMKNVAGPVYVISCGVNNCAALLVKRMEIIYFENRYAPGDIKNVTKTLKGSS